MYRNVMLGGNYNNSTPRSRGNPQTGSATSSSSGGMPVPPSGPGGSSSTKSLPPLFYLMEMGDWARATDRARKHPREVKCWAALRTKYNATTISGAKRLALHHACFKLRNAASHHGGPPLYGSTGEDPFIQICCFILVLIQLYPEAAGMRESRHGCLPLHLAAFASCTMPSQSSSTPIVSPVSDASSSSRNGTFFSSTIDSPSSFESSASTPRAGNQANGIARPSAVTNANRSSSESTSDTMHSNMTNMMAQEYYSGSQTYQAQNTGHRRSASINSSMALPLQEVRPSTNNSTRNQVSVSLSSNFFVSEKREAMAVKVLNALLDAFPKGIRMDSEGGRLPLHTACAGRATPRVIATLLTAYPAAARHRNKDGFLPLHLAAHWGISHPNVTTSLLKVYPDATFGRNRWERTPLEEALCMAGENGRQHQAALVRALRKHPSYWTRPKELFKAESPRKGNHIVDIDDTIPSNEDESTEDGGPDFVNPEGETFKHKMSLFARKGKLLEGQGVEPVSYLIEDLPTLIRNQDWENVLRRLECNPHEAEEELRTSTRGGFMSNSGFLPLHYACERRPPPDVLEALISANPGAVLERTMPGGCLPIHIACTWYASAAAVNVLLMADRSSCKVQDELGNVPLHSACFSGTSTATVEAVVRAYPKAVLYRNNQGSLPEDIVQRLRHDNRREILSMLGACKDEVIRRKAKSSSGNLAAMATKALQLNVEEQSMHAPQSGDGHDDENADDETNKDSGVEIAYGGNIGSSDELIWV